jgi:hypothetical protein
MQQTQISNRGASKSVRFIKSLMAFVEDLGKGDLIAR